MNPFQLLLEKVRRFRQQYAPPQSQIDKSAEFEADLADLIMSAMEVCYAMRNPR